MEAFLSHSDLFYSQCCKLKNRMSKLLKSAERAAHSRAEIDDVGKYPQWWQKHYNFGASTKIKAFGLKCKCGGKQAYCKPVVVRNVCAYL